MPLPSYFPAHIEQQDAKCSTPFFRDVHARLLLKVMTKELVKSENGHKIINTRGTTRIILFSSGSWIKMRITTTTTTTTLWLIVLFLGVASSDSTVSPDQGSTSSVRPNRSTENDSETITQRSPFSNIERPTYLVLKMGNNDYNDLAQETAMESMLDVLVNDDGATIEENNQKDFDNNKNTNREKTSKRFEKPENPTEFKIISERIAVKTQGEINSAEKEKKPDEGAQFDDERADGVSPPIFGRRSRKPKQDSRDGPPILLLTEGGYERPFKRTRFRNSYMNRLDSSEQSENAQKHDRNSNNRRPDERILPRVSYSSPFQEVHGFGARPLLNPDFDPTARNMFTVNHILPTIGQNGVLNAPPTDFSGYAGAAFKPRFQQSDAASFPGYVNYPNNAALYQASQPNHFQSPGMLLQAPPQLQAQPVLMNSRSSIQPHLQLNPFSPYLGLNTEEDSSTPNYAVFYKNPAINSPFQIPPNFYGNVPNNLMHPPIHFLPNYQNPNERVSSRIFRYPVLEVQNKQQESDDQQLDSDASEESKNAKTGVKETGKATSRDDPSATTFGTRLETEKESDVYMRYPTNEAGYATEETLPSKNISQESKDNSERTNPETANFLNIDPYRSVLTSSRNNQRLNNSFDFPPEFFGDGPINFGYQRPPNEILIRYPDRNREQPRYSSHNFEPRSPFYPLSPIPQNNYQFSSGDNRLRTQQESVGTPECAKHKNASFCFEDNDYPRNDILFSLHSNSFLTERLAGPQPLPNSMSLVERNGSESDPREETYACEVATKYGEPLRAKNLEGNWRIIVNLQGRFSQPVRMEVCKSLGNPCKYADTNIKTMCVQKYSLQRLLTWSMDRGAYIDVYKIPVACSCQIIEITKI